MNKVHKLKEVIKKFFDWLWNSESWLSYIIFILLVYIVIKLIFFPLLGFALGGVELPLAIVESSSMDHSLLKYCVLYKESSAGICSSWSASYNLCGNEENNAKKINFDSYWDYCGEWYKSSKEITKEQFENFSFKNGFNKGDILIITKLKKPEIGDVILFKPNPESISPRPIIHRVVSMDPIETKGDHNEGQLTLNNNIYKTDERDITSERVMGIALARIPYLGWIKLAFVELINLFR